MNKNEIEKFQADIKNNENFGLITNNYALGLWETHTSNVLFFNYFLKKERVSAFHVLMCCIFSYGTFSLSEFYSFCSENKISGKNNAIRFVDYLAHADIISLVKMNDRRRKKIVLTEKGREYLDRFTLKTLKPLSIYDSAIDTNVLLTDCFYKHYYNNYNINTCLSYKSDLDLVFHDKQQLLDIQSKSAGLILLMKIFLNIRNGELKIGEEINSLFFKNLSREIGISISHTRNLITLLVDGGFIERENGVSYVIRDSLIKGIEEVISLQLASDYYFIHDFIYNDRK
jgi:DNA-binding transcriptional regulator YhcF (GntR family)